MNETPNHLILYLCYYHYQGNVISIYKSKTKYDYTLKYTKKITILKIHYDPEYISASSRTPIVY